MMALPLRFIALVILLMELSVLLYPRVLEEVVVQFSQQRSSSQIQYTSARHVSDHSAESSLIKYPICRKLQHEMTTREGYAEIQQYNVWIKDGSMVCGKYKAPTLSSLLGWKSKKREIRYWKEGCARHIPAAKSRLNQYLTTLCADQAAASHHRSQNITMKHGTLERVTNHTQADSRNDVETAVNHNNAAANTAKSSNSNNSCKHNTASRGIVYTGEPKHFKHIYQSLTSLVLSNASLPAEVWVNHHAFDLCVSVFLSFAFVQCHCFGNPTTLYSTHTYNEASQCQTMSTGSSICNSKAVVRGFQSKFHALLSTRFTHVLYIDSDNIVTRDASEVFHTTAYHTTGAVLWPDLWGVACRDTSRILAGHTASPQYVLWRAQFPGLDEHTHTVPDYYLRRDNCAASHHILGSVINSTGIYKSEIDCCAPHSVRTCNNHDNHCDAHHAHKAHYAQNNNHNQHNQHSWRYLREYAQETESGQLVLNVRRHRALLLLGLRLMQDSFFSRIIYGDKDIFRFIFLLTGVPFHYMDMPGISVDREGRQDSMLHFHFPVVSQQDISCNSGANSSAFAAQHADTKAPQCEPPGDTSPQDIRQQLPLFVHQLRRQDSEALLSFLRIPLEHRHCSSYCLTSPKRRHRSANSSHFYDSGCRVDDSCCACMKSVRGSSKGASDTNNSRRHRNQGNSDGNANSCNCSDSGVLEQPVEAMPLRDFAQRLFDTVDAEWSYHEQVTMKQYSAWLPPWRKYFYEYVLVVAYSIAAIAIIFDYVYY